MARQRRTRILVAAVLGLALAGPVVAADSGNPRLDELKALLKEARYAEAEAGGRALLAEVEAKQGAESIETAEVLDVLVDALWRGGKTRDPETRRFAERALAIRERALGPDDPGIVTSLNGLAVVISRSGDIAGARPLFERALAIREKALGPDHPDVANSLMGLANLLARAGDYAAARPLFERALAIREKAFGPDDPAVGQSLNNLANVLNATGDYAAARPLYERAIAIREKTLGPDHPDVASAMSNLGVLLMTTGDFAAARALDERSLAIREKALGPNHPDVADSLNNLAKVLQDIGDYAASRPLFERALAIWEQTYGPEHPAVATGLNNLAALLMASGDNAAVARPLLERALAIREKSLGPDHPEVATTLVELASLIEETGDAAAARPMYERALLIFRRALGPYHPDAEWTLNDLARLLAATGDTTDALDDALEAERMGREQCRMTAGSLSEREALRCEASRSSALDLVLNLAARGLDPASRRRALDALVRSRAIVLDDMAARHRSISGTADPEIARLVTALASARAQVADLVVRGPGDQTPEIYQHRLDEARQQEEQAERALAGASSGFARDLSRSRIVLDDVAGNLPPGSALVAFSQYRRIALAPGMAGAADARSQDGPPWYVAFVLRAGERDPQVLDLGEARAIDEAVSRWQQEASRAGLESAYRETGGALRRLVWDPLAPAMGAAARVFIVPDGSLNLVNIAALPLDEGGYLIERGLQVHYLSAERDLMPWVQPRQGDGLLALGAADYDATSMFASLRRPGPKAPTLIAAAGTSTYRGQHSACGDFASARFEPLPATGTETREIDRMWGKFVPGDSPAHAGVLDLRGAAASEAALKGAAPGRRVLHLATHGFFLDGKGCGSLLTHERGIGGIAPTSVPQSSSAPAPAAGENPLLLSGLALAGANHRAAAGKGEDDGILTAEEIGSLDLSGVEWVVLSGCETGVGDVRAGEGVFGLRRAFQVSGAATLIMSLWSVDDASTRSWMKALYEGRLEKKLDTVEAVRRADLEILHHRRVQEQSTHPFYWGAFVAAGDWR